MYKRFPAIPALPSAPAQSIRTASTNTFTAVDLVFPVGYRLDTTPHHACLRPGDFRWPCARETAMQARGQERMGDLTHALDLAT